MSNYEIEYTFPAENGGCTDRGEKCRSIEVDNMTRCLCPPEAGFVQLTQVNQLPYIDVIENETDTKQAVILAVFIFSKYLATLDQPFVGSIASRSLILILLRCIASRCCIHLIPSTR